MTRRGSEPRDDVPERGVTVVLPDHPPSLSPRAARALLELLTSVHNTQRTAEQDQVAWDRTG